MDKANIVLFWGLGLVILNGVANGDFGELYNLIIARQPGGITHAGFGMRLVGELAFVFVMYLISEYSDDGANWMLAFETVLTVLFAMHNASTIQQWTQGQGNGQTPVGGKTHHV